MIRIDSIWLATEPMGMRAGTDTALERVVSVVDDDTTHSGTARRLWAGASIPLLTALEQSLPLHRQGTAAEADAAVAFLMTNGFMNGAPLNIDGGARLV